MKTTAKRYRPAESGMTLIELMIAMVVGLLLLLGVSNIFLAQRQGLRVNDNLAQMQDSTRIAFELMAREIREAGGNPCGSPRVANVLNGASSSVWTDWDAGGVEGFDGNEAITGISTGEAAGQRVENTDALIVRSGSLNDNVIITDHNPPSAQFSVNTDQHGFVAGDILMACDYKQAAIFQMTGPASANQTIVHNTGHETPGNCSKNLTYPTPSPCVDKTCSAADNCKSFEDNGFLARLSVSAWYIGNNGRGGRSLYRIENGQAAQEIVEGVSDMQLQYLTRTGATLAADYVDASSIDDWTDTAAARVIAVRVALDLESRDAVGTDNSTLKRQLLHVVSLRNREIVQ